MIFYKYFILFYLFKKALTGYRVGFELPLQYAFAIYQYQDLGVHGHGHVLRSVLVSGDEVLRRFGATDGIHNDEAGSVNCGHRPHWAAGAYTRGRTAMEFPRCSGISLP